MESDTPSSRSRKFPTMYYTEAQINTAAAKLSALPAKTRKQPKPAKLADLKAQVSEIAARMTNRSIKVALASVGLHVDLRTRRGWEAALEYFVALEKATKSERSFDRFIRYGEANLITRLNAARINTSVLDELAA